MNDFFLSLMLLGAASSGGVSPFWATANRYDIVPQGNGATLLLQTGMQCDTTKVVQWAWGLSAGVSTDTYRPVRAIPDEAYGTVRWKFISLDLGLKRRPQDFLATGYYDMGTLSTTGGNVIWSGNAPSVPGYTLNIHKVAIPGTKGHLSLFGRFGDYCTIDRRFVQWAHIHNTAFGVQIGLSPDNRWLLSAAWDHYAMWGGTSPEYGKLDMSFDSYWRMLFGKSGGKTYSDGDAINVIGNQLGHFVFRLDYKGDKWSVALQHDCPYEDKSFINFPDGVNTLAFRLADRKFWVTDVLYEFQYTLWQGGTCERRPATQEEIDRKDKNLYKEADGTYSYMVNGDDNYFNNYEYRSGWTHGARTIGNPFFLPTGTLEGTFNPDPEHFRQVVAASWAIENNRVMVHHIGIGGLLFRTVPYKLLLTHSLNYGIYHPDIYSGYEIWQKDWSERWRQTPKVQFSGAFQCEIPLFNNRFFIIPAICWDRGQVLGNRVGATLGLRYNFLRNFGKDLCLN